MGTSNTVTTLEDTAHVFTGSDFGFSDPNDTPPNDFLAVKITSTPGTGSLTNNGAVVTTGQFISVSDIHGGKLVFTPAADATGNLYASFTFQVQDDGGTTNGGADLDSTPKTMTVNVSSVNDTPSFTNKGANQTVNANAGAQTVPDWATAVSPGPTDESSQTLTFWVSNDNNGLFSVQPAILANGTLSYTPAANASGSATVTVRLHDDGGIANGGVDTSAPQTFTINVQCHGFWQNSVNPDDVTGDGLIQPLDVLTVIVYINEYGSGFVPRPRAPSVPPPHVDVNGDDQVTALDVLMLISDLNNQEPRASEGEAEGVVNAIPRVGAFACFGSFGGAPLLAAFPVGPASLAGYRFQTPFLASRAGMEGKPNDAGRFLAESDPRQAAVAERDIWISHLDTILPDIAWDINSVWQASRTTQRVVA
ncbi:MAG: dockerin type I domain-containing protein [Planctomycetota bacterium]|nr:dockerin type I domain-containing protein [Planctomycetota bacterium]